MPYQTAVSDRDEAITNAINTRDVSTLYKIAEWEKKEGNDEEADKLVKEAKRIDSEDWAYDESIGN